MDTFDIRLKKGGVGERVILERLEKAGLEPQDLTDYSKFKKFQQKGLDFTFLDKESGVRMRGDSKANILFSTRYNLGMTFMELTKKDGNLGWFWSSKSDYIFIYDAIFERAFYYDLDDMRKYIRTRLDNNSLKVKQVRDGTYGAWISVDYLLSQNLIKILSK